MESDQAAYEINPTFDDYGLVSGFYGPGVLGCWYFLIVSCLIGWVSECKITKKQAQPSADFFAVLLYPTIAVGHLVVQVANFPRGQSSYLVANLLNLLYGLVDGAVLSTKQIPEVTDSGNLSFGVESDEISPLRRQLFPKIASINCSLRILDLFCDLCFPLLAMAAMNSWQRKRNTFLWRRLSRVTLTASILGFLWCWTARMVLLVRTWDGITALALICSIVYRYAAPCVFCAYAVLFLGMHSWTFQICATLWSILSETYRLKRSNWRLVCFLYVAGAMLLLAAVQGIACYMALMLRRLFPHQLFMPHSGSSLMELDQAAALIGGALCLIMSVHRAIEIANQPATQASDMDVADVQYH
jgi:hypothetical protein